MKTVKKSAEGVKFWPQMKDTAIKVFPQVGAFIPRLIEYDGDVFFDLRVFYINDDGFLKPTRKGIRFDMNNTRELRKILQRVRKIAEGGFSEDEMAAD